MAGLGGRVKADLLIDLTVSNLTAIALRFRAFDKTLQRKGRARVLKFHQNVQRLTSRTAPVDTTYMSKHVEIRLQKDGLGGETGWYAETFIRDSAQTKGRFYPPYQEFGSSRNAAQPSLGPAYDTYVDAFEADIKAMLKYSARTA